ncbi:unnamed protein product [Mesocestoides corti]|uniref:Transmembrane protein n=1 Tax=Mesocestoides corti TaxID=53468 RepID=A0A0R3U737_MESCO|nr:unnamed protein product [Mesocestoides corti]
MWPERTLVRLGIYGRMEMCVCTLKMPSGCKKAEMNEISKGSENDSSTRHHNPSFLPPIVTMVVVVAAGGVTALFLQKTKPTSFMPTHLSMAF